MVLVFDEVSSSIGIVAVLLAISITLASVIALHHLCLRIVEQVVVSLRWWVLRVPWGISVALLLGVSSFLRTNRYSLLIKAIVSELRIPLLLGYTPLLALKCTFFLLVRSQGTRVGRRCRARISRSIQSGTRVVRAGTLLCR